MAAASGALRALALHGSRVGFLVPEGGEDALRLGAAHMLDIVLIFQHHAERVVDRRWSSSRLSSATRAFAQSMVSATPAA